MILKKKNKTVVMYQQGGRTPAGSQSNRFVSSGLTQTATQPIPIDISHQAPAGAFQPTGTSKGKSGGYGGGRSSRPAADPTTKVAGLESDNKYAQQNLSNAKAALAQHAAEASAAGNAESHITSQTYLDDKAAINAAVQDMARLKSMKETYNSLKGDDNNPSSAIDVSSRNALAFNAESQEYEITPISQLLYDYANDLNQFKVATIAQAKQLRMNDANFSGFSQAGQQLNANAMSKSSITLSILNSGCI